MQHPRARYYTVYDDRTDTIIAAGTSRECATKMNLTLGSFYSLVSNTQTKRSLHYKYYSVVVEPLNEQLEDDGEE